MRVSFICLLLTVLAACGGEQGATDSAVVTYNIDAERITVSGISSGAYMAGQLHLAHSSIFNGAALLAGGPYWCAEGSLRKGLGPCMKGGDVNLAGLQSYAQRAASSETIDPLTNLADDKVWIFHGGSDAIMHADTSANAAAFYEPWLSADRIVRVKDIAAVHGFPTVASGAPCDQFESPYLNACDYDAAGALLTHLYGTLNGRSAAVGTIREISQPGGPDADMLPGALLYVPESCAQGASCGIHVALHGCLQSAEVVGDAFAHGAGYNEWAEGNHLLVLYPQVASSKIAPLNPNGCWDWWGYTDEGYATKRGPQVATIKAMLDALAGRIL